MSRKSIAAVIVAAMFSMLAYTGISYAAEGAGFMPLIWMMLLSPVALMGGIHMCRRR